MAMAVVVQRLQIGDVILINAPGQDGEVEATVVRDIDRTDATVRATLRVAGREEFVAEWPLGELVTVVRGP
jgi:hypothetical protein